MVPTNRRDEVATMEKFFRLQIPRPIIAPCFDEKTLAKKNQVGAVSGEFLGQQSGEEEPRGHLHAPQGPDEGDSARFSHFRPRESRLRS